MKYVIQLLEWNLTYNHIEGNLIFPLINIEVFFAQTLCHSGTESQDFYYIVNYFSFNEDN